MREDVRRFHVYRSSAGSGKTHALAREFLYTALSHKEADYFKHILAITFTNKATAEMKERILEALAAFSGRKPHNAKTLALQKDVMHALGMKEEAIGLVAATVLDHILHQYTDFSILTIDKFVLGVIRSFARDLQLPCDFEVELDKDKLLSLAVDNLLKEVGVDDELTELLVRYCIRQVDEDKSWNVDRALKETGADLFREDARKQIERNADLSVKQFNEIIHSMQLLRKAIAAEMKRFGMEAVKLLDLYDIPYESLGGGSRGIGVYFHKLGKEEGALFPSRTVLNMMTEGRWHRSHVDERERRSIDAVKDRLAKITEELLLYMDKHAVLYRDIAVILKQIYTAALMSRLRRALNELQYEQRLLHISEFNELISDIVANEPAPFIYERIGVHYRHFFIDEFQDTSVLQWKNLLPLLHNGLSAGFGSLLVGDAKQAIYRWRSGDVKQFIALPGISGAEDNPLLRERQNTLRQQYREYQLEWNYRSGKAIVQFNNFLFSRLSLKLGDVLQYVYKGSEQQAKPDAREGYVSFELLKPDAKDSLQRCLEIIRGLLSDGFRPGDIAILCRDNKTGADVAGYLLQHQIRVVSSDSLNLNHSDRVKSLIALLRSLLMPEETEWRCKAVIHLFRSGILRGSLHALLQRCACTFLTTILQEEGIRLQADALRSLPLVELFETLMRLFGFHSYSDPFLLGLMECVYDYSLHEYRGLQGFLDDWDERYANQSIFLPSGDESVQIMTIHKAKGLQFPAVILPEASWQKLKGKDNVWIPYRNNRWKELKSIVLKLTKELEDTSFGSVLAEEKAMTLLDHFNLLYVACTRASERLYMLSSMPEKNRLAEDFLPVIKKHASWDDSLLKLETGIKEAATSVRTDKKEAELLTMRSVSWRGRIHMAATAGGTSLFHEAMGFGTCLHRVLSMIRTKDEVQNALRVMRLATNVPEEWKAETERIIRAMMDNEEIARFFRTGISVLTEAEILLPGTHFLLRPDRIHVYPDKTEVIDFKTGERHLSHDEQLRRYAGALREGGYPSVNAYLIYTKDLQLISI